MKRHLGKLTALCCGLVLMLVSVWWQGAAGSVRDGLRIWSNAALVPGILLTGIGLLLRISDAGLFDGLSYTMRSLLDHLHGAEKRYASYYEYTRRERKKSAASHMLLPGLCFLAAAILLTLLYGVLPL